MIDQQTIQRIMDATRIEEVIGDFVSLKKRGANHIGCCPFHNEKTPSFYVSPSKGIYKCFGCGEAGDAISFLKKHEHYTYREALEWLAKKYNIEIEEEQMSDEQRQRQSERDGLFHASEFAQKYFADLLWNDEMGRAVGLSYFRQRGMSDDIIRRFGLGYCLDEWSAFTDHALKNGYSLEVLEKTGLSIVREAGEEGNNSGKRRMYDRFRGRVMFPIYSISGRVIAFSGRVLSSEKQAAKYVNSPESDIYVKSRALYGLFQARSAIAKADKCYLVEGNIDVVSMHQSGVENTVASCGTSLTTEQIRLIKRYTRNVTVLYDGDSAGIKAALRAVDLLFAEEMHVRLVLFPDGDDPDSYAQKHGSAALQDYLKEHEENFIMFKTRVLTDGVKNDPIRRAELISQTAQSIAMVTDMLERSEYVRQCAWLLHVDEQVLAAAVGKAALAARTKKSDTAEPAVPTAAPAPAPAQAEVPPAPAPAGDATVCPEVERHLAQLLLNYGNEEITQEYDDGRVGTYTVAQVILSDIRSDELVCSHPLCQRIVEQCELMVAQTGQVDTNSILSSNDRTLRTFAISLMMDTWTLCDGWNNKAREMGVRVPKMEDNLSEDVKETLFTFKLMRLSGMMNECREKLRTANESEQRDLLAELGEYTRVYRQLGAQRGLVIGPRYNG